MSILLGASQTRINFVPCNSILTVIGGVDMMTVTRTFFYKPHIFEEMLDSVNNMYIRVKIYLYSEFVRPSCLNVQSVSFKASKWINDERWALIVTVTDNYGALRQNDQVQLGLIGLPENFSFIIRVSTYGAQALTLLQGYPSLVSNLLCSCKAPGLYSAWTDMVLS